MRPLEAIWWMAAGCMLLPFWDAPLLTVAHARNRFLQKDDATRNHTLLALGLAVACWAALLRGRWPLLAATPAAAWMGACAALAGGLFAAWGKITLGRFFSSTVGVKEGHVLVTHGPYRIVRHPIYAGLILFLFGTSFVWSDAALLGVAGVALLLFARHVRGEDAMFARHFGAAFEDYRRRTPALVPRFTWSARSRAPRA